MGRRLILLILSVIIVLNTITGGDVLAMTPPLYLAFEYKVPRDFIWWLYDKKESGSTQERFIKAYREEQGYLLAPQIDGAVLDNVCWGYENTAVNYRFHNEDAVWRMYVYPVKDCSKEYYYSSDIETLVKNRDRVAEFNKKYSYTNTAYLEFERPYSETYIYFKRKLQLGDQTIVDCVQKNIHCQYTDTNEENASVRLHFFKDGMYVKVSGGVSTVGQENKIADALKKCTFVKLPTNLKLTLDKKKNKISKKNAILHATLQNPTNQDFTYVRLLLYDKKKRRYQQFLKKKVPEKNMRKEKVTLTFNVQKIIKDWRKQSSRRKKYKFPLERKKKYKYKVLTKVCGKYLEVKGSFKLK